MILSILVINNHQSLIIEQSTIGNYRPHPDLHIKSLSKDQLAFTFAVASMCGWRIFMEDTHIARSLNNQQSYIFGIFDGHGGPQVATFVQKHFVEQFQSNKHYDNRNYEKALKQTFLRMDELMTTGIGQRQLKQIHQQMKMNNNTNTTFQESKIGCTANVCLITTDYIYVANVGDSRSIYCNDKGQINPLSKDHKPQDNDEVKRIRKADGNVCLGRVNGNLNITRALGDFQYKQNQKLPPQEQIVTANPEVRKVKNQGIDFILMGCDGIWQIKTINQMGKWIKRKLQKNKIVKNIVQDLLSNLVASDTDQSEFGLDNMSAILIKFHKPKK